MLAKMIVKWNSASSSLTSAVLLINGGLSGRHLAFP